MTLNIAAIRDDFPALSLRVNDHPLCFLDSGASAQKPRAVIDRMVRCMEEGYANVHRGLHYLSEQATSDYESARVAVQQFVGANTADEIVFGTNATALINLVAYSLAAEYFTPDDTVLITAMEHHANIVPWQMAAKQAGFSIEVIPLLADGTLDQQVYAQLLQEYQVKLVAMTHSSNVLGTINPVAEMTAKAHEAGAVMLVDGCQGIVHQRVDVGALDVDFYCASGHKLYGPSGIGFLYGKMTLLEKMPAMLGGGDMIETVEYLSHTLASPPARFEAGTPPIVEAIGLHAAIDYIQSVGLDTIMMHEDDVTAYMLGRLEQIDGLTVYGKAENRAGVASFSLGSAHPQDIAQLLDQFAGVAVRSGHHCAMPLHGLLDVPHRATARASLGLYNSRDDIDILCEALVKVRSLL